MRPTSHQPVLTIHGTLPAERLGDPAAGGMLHGRRQFFLPRAIGRMLCSQRLLSISVTPLLRLLRSSLRSRSA
jgi:hypothetical protein